MRYVSTFHPSQTHLDSTYSDGRSCFRASCRRVSGRNRGCVIVVLTYVVCVLGNLPSFYLFRATPLSTASLFNEPAITSTALVTATQDASAEFIDDSQLMMSFAGGDDVWIDFTVTQRNLSDSSSSNITLSRPGHATLPPPQGQAHEYLLIDLGPFSHVTQPGYIFHWIKSAMGFFIPGVLLTFFNIRLIQALRRSERLRRAAYHEYQSTPVYQESYSTTGLPRDESRSTISPSLL